MKGPKVTRSGQKDDMATLRKVAMTYSKCDYWNDGSDDCKTCRAPMKGYCWNRMCLDLLDRYDRAVRAEGGAE